MAPDDENFRGIHAVRLLDDISDLTLDGLIALAYDSYLPGFEKLVPGLVEAYDNSGRADVRIGGAIEVLRNWDLRVSVDSVAMTLAHFYGLKYREESDLPADRQGMSFMEHIDYLGTESTEDERLRVFAATVSMLEEDFGRWDMPWGEVNRFQRLSGAIDLEYDDEAPSLPVGMASAAWGALASFGARRGDDTKKIYGRSGNSFVAVVEFGDKVRARTLLAGGQSGDPESPHFLDQAQRYADAEFKDVAYYREDVEARASRTYHPGD